MAPPKHSSRGLWTLTVFKLLKCLCLLAIGIRALKLLHKAVDSEVERWVNYLRVDPPNYYIHKQLAKVGLLNDRKLKELSVGTFFYSALLLTEGVGLAFKQRWAEYFTIITTASLLPLEVFEIARRLSFARIALFLVTIAIVVYLVRHLRKNHKSE